MIRWYIAICFLLNSMTILANPGFYANRKTVGPDANAFFQIAIESAPAQHDFILVFDFNTTSENLAALNIINSMTDANTRSRPYESLSDEEKVRHIFAPFFQRLTSSGKPKIIHIDHHYDFPILEQTSTTIMLYDFIVWLHSLKGANAETAKSLLRGIEKAYAIKDHRDADIVLSHLIARHATDITSLRKIGPYIRGAAIFNDYFRNLSTSPREASLGRVLFLICLALENQIEAEKENKLSYEEGIQVALEAALFVADVNRTFPSSITNFVEYFSNNGVQVKQRHAFVFSLLKSGLERNNQVQRRMQAAIDEGQELQSRGQLDVTNVDIYKLPIAIRKFRNILIVNLITAPGEETISNGDVIQAIYVLAPQLFEGIDVIVANVREPNRNVNVKMRSLNPAINLERVYAHFRGLDPRFASAGGRAAAGSLSKSGFSMPESCGDVMKSPFPNVAAIIHTLY